jgi:Streptomyces sporulation and cell division protein, SsgA
VRIRPTVYKRRPVVAVALSSPSGHADIELPQGKVTTFLGHAHLAVPAGTESNHINWAAELNTLLRPHNP